MNYVELDIELEEELFEKLKDTADELGCSIEELINEALKNYLDPEVEEI